MTKHWTAGCLVAIMLSVPVTAGAADRASPEQPSEVWLDLRETLFDTRDVADGSDLITLDAPYRAHDAAMVPVEITVTPEAGRSVRGLTLIVDENPAPVAAEFEIGPAMGRTIELSTRLRVNAYSNVRVIAEMDDGSLYQYARFVKASGGCAAPATKDAAAALAALGKMRLREFAPRQSVASGDRRVAQVMVRHPNNSGFQVDQITQLYVPAFFVDTIDVTRDGESVFRMTGGISLSEDPSLRFGYDAGAAGVISVAVTDTDGGVYSREFATGTGS